MDSCRSLLFVASCVGTSGTARNTPWLSKMMISRTVSTRSGMFFLIFTFAIFLGTFVNFGIFFLWHQSFVIFLLKKTKQKTSEEYLHRYPIECEPTVRMEVKTLVTTSRVEPSAESWEQISSDSRWCHALWRQLCLLSTLSRLPAAPAGSGSPPSPSAHLVNSSLLSSESVKIGMEFYF